MTTNKKVFYIISLLSALFIIALAPMTQSQDYHHFAEQRVLAGIPHFGDVLSNLAFVIAGVLLLLKAASWDQAELYPQQKTLFKALCYASIVLGLGSGYYHWTPNDYTLAWDRAAMVLGFAVIFVDSTVRYGVFPSKSVVNRTKLVAVAFVGTVLFWMATDRLEPYVFVQFFTMFALVVLAATNFNSIPSKHLVAMFVWYFVAKLCEHYDDTIYSLSANLVSGHTLKHVAYAVALYVFGKDMLVRRVK